MGKWYDLYYAAKAWVGAVVVAVGELITLAQVAVADEAISLTEARGMWLAVTQAATVLVGFWAVYQARNRPASV